MFVMLLGLVMLFMCVIIALLLNVCCLSVRCYSVCLRVVVVVEFAIM